MKTQNKKRLIAVILTVIFMAAIITAFVLLKPPSAQKIFSQGIISIVELKCETQDVGESFGTAEIVSKDGTLITNAHVVTYTRLGILIEFEKYYIRFATEEDYREAELIKYDINSDIAVLKIKDIKGIKIKPIKTADSSELKSGDKVYAVGNASNHGISITQGIISIPLVEIIYDEKSKLVIQCDLTITEGNSGGALLDERGRLIGITTFRIKDSNGNVVYGLAFCITINLVLDYINS